MRASMKEDRLSSLALIHTHYDMAVDLEKAVDIFAQLHRRKLELTVFWMLDVGDDSYNYSSGKCGNASLLFSMPPQYFVPRNKHSELATQNN